MLQNNAPIPRPRVAVAGARRPIIRGCYKTTIRREFYSHEGQVGDPLRSALLVTNPALVSTTKRRGDTMKFIDLATAENVKTAITLGSRAPWLGVDTKS